MPKSTKKNATSMTRALPATRHAKLAAAMTAGGVGETLFALHEKWERLDAAHSVLAARARSAAEDRAELAAYKAAQRALSDFLACPAETLDGARLKLSAGIDQGDMIELAREDASAVGEHAVMAVFADLERIARRQGGVTAQP